MLENCVFFERVRIHICPTRSMMGGGELIDDEDRKTNIFVGEITESLQRGIEEGVDANNLVLEINSSRYVK